MPNLQDRCPVCSRPGLVVKHCSEENGTKPSHTCFWLTCKACQVIINPRAQMAFLSPPAGSGKNGKTTYWDATPTGPWKERVA